MTSDAVVRHDGRMTQENQWARLHRIAEARRLRLGLTQPGVTAAGGPTGAWLRGLRSNVGAPTPRMKDSLDALDHALLWREGTSWGLVAEDRSDWGADALEDEEAQLVEEDDEAGHMGTIVTNRLRLMPPEEAEKAMREIVAILGLTQS